MGRQARGGGGRSRPRAAEISAHPEMVWSSEPWKPQRVREMEVSWEAALRQKGTQRQGDGKSDVVKEQCEPKE